MDNSAGEQPGSGSKAELTGALMVLAGLLVSPASIGALLAQDGVIDHRAAQLLIYALSFTLVGFGIALALGKLKLGSLQRGMIQLASLVLILAACWGIFRSPLSRSQPVAPERVLGLQELCDWIHVEDPNIGVGNLAKYGALLAAARQQPEDRSALGDAAESLAEIQMRHGFNEEALALFAEALELAQASGRPEEVLQRLRRSLGVANLRLGEASHCIAMHNPESCLFPITGGGVWSDPSGAIQAAEYFLEFLAHDPGSLDVRWLLNVAHQVAGTHPAGVPADYLIPLSTFDIPDPDISVGRFRELGATLGVNSLNMCGGAIMEDLDGDGLLDLFSTSMDFCLSVNYFHNAGDGSFENWTERAGLSAELGGFNCVQGDVDGDGRLDIVVLRGAWQGRRFGAQRNSLLRQRPDGTFQDATEIAGLGQVAYPSQVGVFADYDLDGDLDLFVGNEYAPCQLFTNDGRGRFVDRASEAGVVGLSNCAVKGASWGDFDNDGDPDLYVSNYGKPNRLYKNDGAGSFVDVAEALGVQALDSELNARPGDEAAEEIGRTSILGRDFTRTNTEDQTFVSWFWDMDNDGWLDLFVGGFGGSLADIAGSYLDQPVAVRRHLRVFRNDRKGGFENVSRAMNVDDVHLPMGANYGDLDNDGFQDFYLGTGRPGFEFLVPNAMYLNAGGERFVDVTAAAGVGHLQKGHGVALGDLDNDGDLDIFAQMGGFFYADAFQDALFENPGNHNHWLTLQLRGTSSNTFGVGARIKLTLTTPAGTREVHALAGSGASFGGSSLQQELGLGAASTIQRLEIQWPGAELQVFEDVPMDTILRATQGQAELERQDLPALVLGG